MFVLKYQTQPCPTEWNEFPRDETIKVVNGIAVMEKEVSRLHLLFRGFEDITETPEGIEIRKTHGERISKK